MGQRERLRYEKEPVRPHLDVGATSYIFLYLSAEGASEEGLQACEAARGFECKYKSSSIVL
jgi:hypothetical protein